MPRRQMELPGAEKMAALARLFDHEELRMLALAADAFADDLLKVDEAWPDPERREWATWLKRESLHMGQTNMARDYMERGDRDG